jgi:hypothetical protein
MVPPTAQLDKVQLTWKEDVGISAYFYKANISLLDHEVQTILKLKPNDCLDLMLQP